LKKALKLGGSCEELVDLSGHSPGIASIIFEGTVFVGDAVFGVKIFFRLNSEI